MPSKTSQKTYLFVNAVEAISIISFVLIFILSTIRLLVPQKTWIDNYIIGEPWGFLIQFIIARYIFSFMLSWATKSKLYSSKYWKGYFKRSIVVFLSVIALSSLMAGPVAGAIFLWVASSHTRVVKKCGFYNLPGDSEKLRE